VCVRVCMAYLICVPRVTFVALELTGDLPFLLDHFPC